jgi:hypothetical protein
VQGHPVPLFDIKGTCEAALAQSEMEHTILWPSVFMEVWLGAVVGLPLMAQQPITLIGKGDHRHNFVSEADVAAFAVAAVDNPRAANQRIGIGGSASCTWTEIVAAVGRAMGTQLPIQYLPPGLEDFRLDIKVRNQGGNMNRKIVIGLIAGTAVCLTLAGASTPAGAQDAGPQAIAPNSADAPNAAAGTAITFQGQLKKDGGTFSGACSFRFTLFDAATGTGQVGTPLPVDATVTNGLFTVPLDFGNQFTGQARWLETAVKCAGDADYIPQSPRLNLTSSPYAIGLMPGASINGDGNEGLKVNTPNGYALLGYSNTKAGVLGASQNFNGVRGIGYNQNHAAVVGLHEASGFGVLGQSAGNGVVGLTTNGAVGVFGRSSGGSTGIGVWGETDTSGPGVYGKSYSGAGVWGTSVGAFGVYGETTNNYAIKGKSLNSVGVYGESTNSHGVVGRTSSANAYAVYADGKVAISGGTDIAERFSSASEQQIESGTVVMVDEAHPGQIIPSGAAYARTVVGIVSGAGGVEPGLILHQSGMMEGPHVVAIAGRVYVKATAANGAIKPGDLLTTANLPGHAMKATDRDAAFGAVIGKALTGLDSGTGLVLVLVNLQ